MDNRSIEKSYWIKFLETAEFQFDKIVTSSLGTEEFWLLPKKFNTRQKIYTYFRKYWSKTYSNKMLCNLHTKKKNGKLYVPEGDPGPQPTIKEIEIHQGNSTCKVITTKYGYDWEKKEEYRLVIYILTKDKRTRSYVISKRISEYKDYRFEKCPIENQSLQTCHVEEPLFYPPASYDHYYELLSKKYL